MENYILKLSYGVCCETVQVTYWEGDCSAVLTKDCIFNTYKLRQRLLLKSFPMGKDFEIYSIIEID